MFNNYKLKPMLLKEVDKIFNNENYLYEVKYDGYRVFIYASNTTFKIISRNGQDLTNTYPELKAIQKIVGKNKVIFDGEIIAVINGLPNFSKLQTRSKLKNITEEIILDTPIYFICFDIIYQNKDLTNLVLIKRKEILNTYPDNAVFIKSETFTDGKKLFASIKKLGLEGVVAKQKNSLYYPGKRVDTWLKIKNIKDNKFFIHGYVFNKEKYSLLLGEKTQNGFNFVGKVSITKNNHLLKQVLNQKKHKNIFNNYKENATFIEPKLKVTITYLERTKAGKLRHPALK